MDRATREPVAGPKRPADRGRAAQAPARWSRRVTRTSDALDLEAGVFSFDDPRRIAMSLKRSAERSQRRRSEPFRSAMSMLNLYINRAGRQLDASTRARLEQAKDELRSAFGRPRQTGRDDTTRQRVAAV